MLKLLKDEDGEIVFGLPNRSGEYLITKKSGSVTTDFFDVDDGLFENYDLSEIYAVAEIFGIVARHDLDALVAIGNDPNNSLTFSRMTRYAEKALYGDY